MNLVKKLELKANECFYYQDIDTGILLLEAAERIKHLNAKQEYENTLSQLNHNDVVVNCSYEG